MQPTLLKRERECPVLQDNGKRAQMLCPTQFFHMAEAFLIRILVSGVKSAFTDISAAQQGQACYCCTCHRLMHLIHPVLFSVNRLPLP